MNNRDNKRKGGGGRQLVYDKFYKIANYVIKRGYIDVRDYQNKRDLHRFFQNQKSHQSNDRNVAQNHV